MPKKAEKEHTLDENQIKFITQKVKDLGDSTAVYRFYNLKDNVSEFARSLVDEPEGTTHIAPKAKKKATPKKKAAPPKAKKKAKVVRRKRRRIDTSDLED